MATWSNISTGFDILEESFNFGTRAVFLGEECVFESATIATIHADEQSNLSESPLCNALFTKNIGVIIASDKSLTLFQNNFTVVAFSINFEASIECIEVPENEDFIFCGLLNGNFLCLNMQNKGKTLFSKSLEDEKSGNRDSYFSRIISKCSEKQFEVYAFLKNGSFVRAYHEDIKQLIERGNSEDSNDVSEFIQFSMSNPTTAFYKNVIVSPIIKYEKENMILRVDEAWKLSSLDGREFANFVLHGCATIKKIHYAAYSKNFVCLCGDGSLLIVSAMDFQVIKKWEGEKVKTFSFYENIEDQTATGTTTSTILIITDSDQPEICVMEFPALKVELRLKVAQCTYLVDKLRSIEDIVYIEGFGDEGSPINSLRIKTITESSPGLRLERLLKRCKFTEAEKFALSFNLSLEEVHKAKVKWIMDKLSSNKTHESSLDYFNELFSLLQKIEDIQFIGECSLLVIAPNLKLTQKLYNYALERLQRVGNETANCSEVLNLINNVIESINTLVTYIKVYNDFRSSEEWLIFSRSNPIIVCKSFLSKGNIQKAEVVCKLHRARIQREIPKGVALELFKNIPPNLPMEEVLRWLRIYLPILITAFPETQASFISWAINRIVGLELNFIEGWLVQGLNFINEVIKILNSLLPFDSQDSELHEFALQMKQLLILKEEYNIKIKYQEFHSLKQNSTMELICFVLSKVHDKKFSSFIQGFLMDFCATNYIERDLVLYTYVKKTVKIPSRLCWDIQVSNWEPRVIAVIGHIHNIQHKMKAIETIVGYAYVPWSDQVTALANEALKIDDPLAQKIYDHIKNVPRKIILKKYGIPLDDNFDGSICNNGTLHGLMKYIYKKNRSSMLDDAKQLVYFGSPTEKILPYLYYLLHTIELGEIEKGLLLIKSELDKKQIIHVIQRGISNLITLVQYRHIVNEEYFNAIPALYSALTVLDIKASNEFKEDVHFISYLRILKVKYKIFENLKIYYKPKNERLLILRQYLEKISLENKSTLYEAIYKAEDLASLLNFPKELGILELFYLYSSSKNFSCDCGIQFLRLLVECNDSFYKAFQERILELAAFLLKLSTNGLKPETEFWELIIDILKNLTCYCNKGCLKKSFELLKMANLLKPQGVISQKPPSKHVYSEQEVPQAPPQIYSKLILKDYLNSVKLTNGEDSSSSNKDNDIIQKEIEDFLKSMSSTLTSIQRFHTVAWAISSKGITLDHEKINELISEKTFNLLPRVMFSRHLDIELTLGLLNLVTVEDALTWLQTYLSARKENWDNYKKASIVALVGANYLSITDHWDKNNLMRRFTEYYFKFECFRKLKRFQITPKVANTYCETFDGKKALLLKLMSFPEMDVNFLHEICKGLNFHFQECLQLYLEHTLLTWEVQYKETFNIATQENDLVLLSKKEDLSLKCSQIIALINVKEELVECLKDVLKRVNLYYYEVYIVIIETILSLKPSAQEMYFPYQHLLSFLMSYKRISPLSSEETDNWFHCFPDTTAIPLISKYRLPFTTLPTDPWKIIKPELTLKTYKSWLNAPRWFNVTFDNDVICSFTIMNLKGKLKGTSEWSLHSEHKPLMIAITECISFIKNIETAVAASYCVVNYVIPPGADRVEAAQRCFLKAQQWATMEHSESARIGLVKAEKKYFTVSTHHFLYKYQLAKPEYLALAHQPLNLITALYHEPSLFCKGENKSIPDINKVVLSIGNLHDMNLAELFKQFLTEWIQPEDSMSSSSNDSILEIEISPISTTQLMSDNIKRACYLLGGFKDMPILEKYLLKIALGEDVHNKSPGVRLHALQCLRATNTNAELERLIAPQKISSIGDLMRSLELICDLEKLSLTFTVSEFDSRDKMEVIEMLLNISYPGAIVLATKISVTYSLWQPSIWNKLLSQMISLNMVNLFEYALPQIRPIANLIDSSLFKKAWESFIFSTLNKLRCSSDFDKEIEETLDLIESCPIMTTIDLSKIIELCKEYNYTRIVEELSKFVT